MQIRFCALLLALSSPAFATEPRAEKMATLAPSARAAAAVIDSFHAALRRGDADAASALLAENALIFEEGGAERSRREYHIQHLPADAAFAKAVRSETFRRAGAGDGTFAWVTSEGRTTGLYKGKPIDRLTTETMVLRHSSSGWRIVHIHWSSRPTH